MFPTVHTDPASDLTYLQSPHAAHRMHAFLYDSLPHYLLPDGVRDAARLLAFLHAYEFETDVLLPAPLPSSLAVCRRLAAYRTSPEGEQMAAYCMGETEDLAAEVVMVSAQARLPLMPVRAEHDTILEHYALPPQMRHRIAALVAPTTPTFTLTPAPAPADTLAPSPPVLRPRRASQSPSAPVRVEGVPVALNTITIAPAALMQALSERLPHAARRSWPFKRMEVGQMVRLCPDDASRGQRAAHAHAVKSRRKYQTFVDHDGSLVVCRVR